MFDRDPCGASTARGQKRKRSPQIAPTIKSTPPPEPPWKRAGFRSAEEANIAFWDNLTKVPLCPPALREFDRRNRKAVESKNKPSLRSTRRCTRSAARNIAQLHRLGGPNNIRSEDSAAGVKRFARRGGPDLLDLRGCPGPEEAFSTMPPRKTPNGAPSSSAKSSGRTSAYNPGFEQNLIRHGVYPNGYKHLDNRASVQPDNWEAIQQRLAQPRASLSPSRFSEGAFHVYQGKADGALDEADVMANAFPILQGETELPSAFRRTFQNLEPLTDGTIVDAEPDHYVGARPEQLDTSIHEKLGPFVVPSKHTAAPIVPNNSTEAKGPSGTRTVLKLQACYDGAIGARAVQCLQSFGEPKPVYDNNAYTITSTFDGELLSMYTTHPTAPTNSRGRPEYHMNRLGSFALVGTPDVFRQGATAYRNARDWTKERRDEFINTANERARASRQETSVDSSGYSDPSTPTHMAAAPESETSADEVAADVVTETHRSKKRVKRSIWHDTGRLVDTSVDQDTHSS